MNYSDLRAVAGKELRETLRNLHSIGILLVVCAFYPASLLVLSTALKGGSDPPAQCKVSVQGDVNFVRPIFAQENITLVSLPVTEALSQLEANKLDAVVTVPSNIESYEDAKSVQTSNESSLPTIVIQTNKSLAGRQAGTKIATILDKLQSQKLHSELEQLPGNEPWFTDVSTQSIDIPGPKVGRYVAVSLPFLMTVIILAMCAASSVESINGEKTRKTWHLLLASGLDRNSLIYGKLLSSVGCAFLGIIVCLLSMLVCSQLAERLGLQDGANFQIAEAFCTAGLAVPLAISLSALFVLLCLIARNTQEAGLFSSGATVVCALLPAIAAIPLKYAAPALYVVPIVNVSLCISESLQIGLNAGHFAAAVISSALVAAACLVGCTKVLNNESLMFGISTPIEYRKDHSGTVFLLCSCVYLLFIYVGQLLITKEIFLGTIVTQTLLLALPAVYAVRKSRLPVKLTMRLLPVSWRKLIGGGLLAPGVTLAAVAVASFQNSFLPMPIEFDEMMKTMILKGRPMWQTVLAMAVTPGICEEILFRGAVLGMLCRNMKPINACLVTGVLFGLFHMSSFRFLPTGVAGVVLSVVAISSGSIFPSMMLHAVHNCCAIFLALNEDNLQMWHLVAALMSTACGAHLLWFEPEKKKSKPHEASRSN